VGTTGAYNVAKFQLATKQLDLSSADLRVLLVASGYVFNPDHRVVSDITSELSGTGYLRQQLQTISVVEDDVNNVVTFDAADMLWAGANFTGGAVDAAIIYIESSNTDSLRQLVCSVNLNPKITTAGSNYTVSWGANGILRLS